MASLPQLQPDAAMAHATVSSQPLQPQPTAALALSSALSAGALTPVQQASVPLQSGQLPLLVAAGGSAASGSGVGSDTGIPRTPASSNGVVDGTGSSAGTGAVGNSPRLASAGVPVASESDSRTLLAEYWFRVGKLQGQQAQVLSEMDRLEKIAQRASGDVAAKSRRNRRLLVEVYKRCRVEPGSAEAANYPICGNVVKLMRAADECLIKFIATKASARAAAAAPTPGLPEGGAAEPPPAFVCPITQDVMSDPVVAADGHTYERGMIEKWVRQGLGAGASGPGSSGPRSPMTNEPLPNTALVPNLALRSAIKEWQEQRERQRLQQQHQKQQRVQQQQQQQHQRVQQQQQQQQQQQEQQRLQQGQQGMQRTGSRQLPDVA